MTDKKERSAWYDQNDADAPDFSQPLDIDNYNFEVTRFGIKAAAESGTMMADCEFTVVDDERNEGRKVWEYLMLEGAACFRIGAFLSAIKNPEKVPREDGKGFEDRAEGGRIVYMNEEIAGEIASLQKKIPLDDEGNPVWDDEGVAKGVWDEIAELVMGAQIQAATNHEVNEYPRGVFNLKAQIGRYAPVMDKTLKSWEEKSQRKFKEKTEAAACADVGDGDNNIPF